MKRFILVALLGLVALLHHADISHAQKTPAPQTQLTLPKAPFGDHLNDEIIIQLPGTTRKSTINLRTALNASWRKHEPEMKKLIAKHVQSLGLYDVTATPQGIQTATPTTGARPTIYFGIYPAGKKITVIHHFVGNTMSAKLDVPLNADPMLSGRFDLDLVMVFNTAGKADNPLVLESTKFMVKNFRPDLYDIRLDGMAKAFAKKQLGDPGIARDTLVSLNTQLRPYTFGRNLSSVTPDYSRTNLILSLTTPGTTPTALTAPK